MIKNDFKDEQDGFKALVHPFLEDMEKYIRTEEDMAIFVMLISFSLSYSEIYAHTLV